MSTYDFVHLVIHACGGSIEGRTKLQKTVYFIGAMMGKLPELGYKPRYYGPFSGEVAGSVNELRGLGFLEQRTAGIGSRDDNGFEVLRYDSVLTSEGKQIAEEKAEANPDIWMEIQRAVGTLSRANANDYVKLSIAAKAFFLLEESQGRASIRELWEMTSKFGWKVSNEQLHEAGDILQSLGLCERTTIE